MRTSGILLPTILTLGVAVIVALGTAPAVWGQIAEAGAVTGTVSDVNGAPVVGATVTLRGPGGATVRNVRTEAGGSYRVPNVPPGTYTLVVYKDGFAPVEVGLEVAEETVSHDATLKLATFSEEISVSFTSQEAYTALKMDASILEIPLTVKSYTASFVKALDAKQVADLYTYMNGINRSGGGAYNFTVRGFAAGEPNTLGVNGLPGLAARQNSPNIANVERIEVLKGPSSVLYGRAEPGGMVNLITKRPQPEQLGVVDLRSSSFSGEGPSFGDAVSYRFALDLTGPVGDSERYLYRFIASYDDFDSFRDFVEQTDTFIAPSLTVNFTPSTFLTLEGEYRELDSTLDQGLIAPQQDINFIAPIDTFYQEPDDFENEEGWTLNAYFTHLQSSDTVWNVTFRTVDHEDDRKGFENRRVLDDNRTLLRRDRHQINNREYHYIDANVSTTLQSGSVGHTFLFGLNGGKEVRDFDRLRFGNQGFFIDIYEPVYGLAVRPEDPRPQTHRIFDLYDYGAYVQDRIDFSERWKALLALRWASQSTELEFLRFDRPPLDRDVNDLTQVVGLVYQPNPHWSLYGSFATSFDPQSVTAQGETGENLFDPEEGEQIEGGFKAELMGGRFNTTLALYEITKQNVVIPTGFGFDDQIGEERSRGVEFDMRLRPMSNWQLIFGYAYTDAEVTEDTREDRVGAKLLNTPENAFNVWSRYDLASGLGFGIGLIYRDDRAGSFPSQVVRGAPEPGEPVAQEVLILPSYFRADVGVYWVRDPYELTLRINNLFDEIYYESAFNLVRITPGNPREATLSLRLRF